MSQRTDERAFEAHVEQTLLQESGWEVAPNDQWDADRALFPARVCSFLEETQPGLWAKLRTLLGEDLEQQTVSRASATIMAALDRGLQGERFD